MSGYRTAGSISSIEWKGRSYARGIRDRTLPVVLAVEIPADRIAGLDPTRPITITQEEL